MWKKTNLRGAYNQVILAENYIDLQKIAKSLWYIDTL